MPRANQKPPPFEAIRRVLEYSWHDEQENYERSKESAKHIFVAVLQVRDWLLAADPLVSAIVRHSRCGKFGKDAVRREFPGVSLHEYSSAADIAWNWLSEDQPDCERPAA